MHSWVFKKFDDLSPHELYAILQLRNEVFAIEQNCVYSDLDNKDQPSYHLMGWSKGLSRGVSEGILCDLADLSEQDDKADSYRLAAYARIIPPAVIYPEPSIGRVVTSPAARGNNIGKELMEQSINKVYKLYGKTPIRIGAQLYLLKFYTGLGFHKTSAVYLEDGIEHIEMVKP